MEAAEKVEAAYEQDLTSIADGLLKECTEKLALRGPLVILFGNGGESITYCGCPLYLDYGNGPNGVRAFFEWNPWGTHRAPEWAWDEEGEYVNDGQVPEIQTLAEALVVAIGICHGYSRACPNDIKLG